MTATTCCSATPASTCSAAAPDDEFFGGSGAETFSGGGGSPLSEFDEEPSLDFAIYRFRTNPVSVTLDDVADDGGAGEGDNVMSDVEVVFGGAAGDILTGNDSSFNALLGGRGNHGHGQRPPGLFGRRMAAAARAFVERPQLSRFLGREPG